MSDVGALRFTWPAFRCVAIDAQRADSCGLPAKWRSRPLEESATWWCYCDRHRPAAAERIPDDAPFRVTRVTVTVALASMQELRTEAAIEATLRVEHALEGVGAAIVRMHVHGRLAGAAGLEPSPFRLLLAGPGEPVEGGRPNIWPATAAERYRRQVKHPSIAAGRASGEPDQAADRGGKRRWRDARIATR